MISSFITDSTPTADFETITVSTTAIGFTAAKILAHIASGFHRRAVKAFVTVETDSIRIRTDGTAPTSSVGHQFTSGTSFTIIGEQDIINFRAIRSGSADASIQVSYVFNQ